jgi:hypothetical protein|tara:strand:+ start:243 stop:407 length:165 start_codon:yes stop_codon:yes gene_type:complete
MIHEEVQLERVNEKIDRLETLIYLNSSAKQIFLLKKKLTKEMKRRDRLKELIYH